MRENKDVITETKNIVRIDSTAQAGERKIVKYLDDRFDSSPVEFDVDIQQVDPEDTSRQNIVARAGNPERGTVMLTGHLDVVPAIESDWSVPPFELTRNGDRLVGRGTTDMKGSLAGMLIAAEEYLTSADDPGEVVLAFVAAEETGGAGTQRLVERGIDADAAILGEPTNLTIGRANKGAVRYDIIIEGESAHSGRPDRGINATSLVPDIITALESFDAELNNYTHELLEPRSTVTVTGISGGTAPNIVPNQVTVTFDWRYLPNMPDNSEWYDTKINGMLDEISDEALTISLNRWNFKPAAGIDSTAPIVSAIEEALETAHCEKRHTGFNAGTDAGYLSSEGIPTVLFGPGSIENEAHTVEESVSVEELVTSVDIYHGGIKSFFQR